MIKKRKNNIFKNIIISSFIILAILLSGFVIWAKDSYNPTEDAKQVFKNIDVVDITEEEFIIFTPKDNNPSKGFIFYPGGKVNPEAYSILAKGIAEKGYLGYWRTFFRWSNG